MHVHIFKYGVGRDSNNFIWQDIIVFSYEIWAFNIFMVYNMVICS